jgi:DNA helicase-2/ATP-dependent DNA helicase PcrA
LVLTQAELRRLHGNEHYTSPSRFLGEIPEELIQEIRAKPVATPYLSARPPAGQPAQEPPAGMRLGSRVRHGTFGDGVVLRYEGQGSHARVQVNFEAAGTKWLVIGYANLQSL